MDVVSSGRATPAQTSSRAGAEAEGELELDPVAASTARNRQMLERMQRMQEEALRGTFDEEQEEAAAQRRRTREEQEQLELERASDRLCEKGTCTHSTGDNFETAVTPPSVSEERTRQ